jgi:hypothetical protein
VAKVFVNVNENMCAADALLDAHAISGLIGRQ